jgi:hypothetical protein
MEREFRHQITLHYPGEATIVVPEGLYGGPNRVGLEYVCEKQELEELLLANLLPYL